MPKPPDADLARRRRVDLAQLSQFTARECTPVLRPGAVDWNSAPITPADIQAVVPALTVAGVGVLSQAWAQFPAGTVVASGWYEAREFKPPVDVVVFVRRPEHLGSGV